MLFFRKAGGKATTAASGATTPEMPYSGPNGRSYDPTLIPSLQAEHARLGMLYQRIGELGEKGQFAEARALLTHFKSSLQAHILTENTRLYAYLERLEPAEVQSIRTFRRDMDTIARQVIAFVKTWQHADFATAAERQRFRADYQQIGQLLEHRLRSEENGLYTRYQPS